jgi:hypothetical protein
MVSPAAVSRDEFQIAVNDALRDEWIDPDLKSVV